MLCRGQKNAEYVLLTKCAAFHFDSIQGLEGFQTSVRQLKSLPVKYRSDPSCRKGAIQRGVPEPRAPSYQFGVLLRQRAMSHFGSHHATARVADRE